MLAPEYINAIETRLRWLKWARSENSLRADPYQSRVLPWYERTLTRGETFYMNSHFAELVDHARQCAPDDLVFDEKWLHAPDGWLYFDVPFNVPLIKAQHKSMQQALAQTDIDLKDVDANLNRLKTDVEAFRALSDSRGRLYARIKYDGIAPDIREQIRQIDAKFGVLKERLAFDSSLMQAIGWWRVPEGLQVSDNARTHGSEVTRTAGPNTFMICVFQKRRNEDRPGSGFSIWSYFLLKPGDALGARVREFEAVNDAGNDGSTYVSDPEDTVQHPLHEIRWVYAALHLMAQRLTVTVKHATDRHTRRRAEREQQQAPPYIQVVTLRRLETDRKSDPKGGHVDWQWQWVVRGFWRNQYFPSENTRKQVWIESYVKGPSDRPMKPPGTRLYTAIR